MIACRETGRGSSSPDPCPMVVRVGDGCGGWNGEVLMVACRETGRGPSSPDPTRRQASRRGDRSLREVL